MAAPDAQQLFLNAQAAAQLAVLPTFSNVYKDDNFTATQWLQKVLNHKTTTEEIVTEGAIITTEEIEMELHITTLTQTEEDNKPHNTGATQAGAETKIEETEEAALKTAALNSTHNLKTT